jgi:hypothetical protein
MQRFFAVLSAGLLLSSSAHAAVVQVNDSSATWNGFMNVFELPSNGGAFIFASGWGVADLVATFDDANSKLTLSPNTIGDPDPFWYQGGGGPGQLGNKFMEANLYQQVDDGSLSGQTVTFQGTVLTNTFTQAHETRIFIRDFAPDYSSFNETIVPAIPGAFSIDLLTDGGAGRHVQWGFQTRGENVWITDTAPFGNVMISTIPAPSALALMGLGGCIALRRRR